MLRRATLIVAMLAMPWLGYWLGQRLRSALQERSPALASSAARPAVLPPMPPQPSDPQPSDPQPSDPRPLAASPGLDVPPAPAGWRSMTAQQRLADLDQRRRPGIESALQGKGLALGLPAFLRVFKESRELELWLEPRPGAALVLYQVWPIAAASGELGPKLREGDGQAPEGCYSADAKRMNPLSNYHLSFNLGYPNAYDLAHGRTGSFLMVHGKDVSIGCYAMTDPVIEEIYLIVAAALAKGQREVAVHCFPFRMTTLRMAQATAEGTEWLPFWQELQPIWQAFETQHRVPRVSVVAGRYQLRK